MNAFHGIARSHDEAPVRLLFMIAAAYNQHTDYLNSDLRATFLAAKTPNEIYSLLINQNGERVPRSADVFVWSIALRKQCPRTTPRHLTGAVGSYPVRGFLLPFRDKNHSRVSESSPNPPSRAPRNGSLYHRNSRWGQACTKCFPP